MNLVQLNYFISVCEKKSISEAAREHKVTQPCITNALHELEKEYEIPLFFRYKNHLTPTQEGKELLAYAVPLCRTVKRAEHLFEVGEKIKRIRIGIPGRLSGMISPSLFSRFRKEYPGIDLEFAEFPSANIAEAVIKDELDFGIVILKSEIEKHMKMYEFCEVKMKLCVHKDNPLAILDKVTPQDIGGQPIISLQGGGFKNDFFTAKMQECGIEPNILLRTNQVITMIEFIRQNLAIGFLFADNVSAYPEIVSLDTSWQFAAPVGLIWAENKRMSREEILFAEYVKTYPW